MDIRDFVSELKHEITVQNKLAQDLSKYDSEHIKGYKIGIENTIKSINEIIEKFEKVNREELKMNQSKKVVFVIKNF